MSGANLFRANLSGATIGAHKVINLVARAGRTDGYEFLIFRTNLGHIIRAGCRTMTLAEYREHVKRYPDPGKVRETTDILDYLEKILLREGF